jgi:amino acid permease
VGDEAETPSLGASDALFSRDEVLGGLPARRARTLLFLIESRTAHLVAKSRHAMDLFPTEEAERERDLAFLEAFALGRDPPLRPTIQDLESHAARWADLVPDNPQVRAAVAHLLGEKYRFTSPAVPGIRSALSLDAEPVQQAYRRLYRNPIETVYAPRTPPGERLRWVWAALNGWLESLPPFWTVFALTLTETVGATTLALPIALAQVGPLAGVTLLIVLGLVNQLTIVSLAEAFARSGNVRYGNAFFGRLVAEYLGNAGSVIVSSALAVLCFVALLAFYIGLSTFLSSATPVPTQVWAALLFLIGLYYLSRESLKGTVASALLVGAINLGAILVISLVAFAHLRPENLLYVRLPFLEGRPFEPALLELVFGVIAAAYCGHLSTGNCARIVLRRDPGARSLIRGVVAAQAVAMVFYCLWVLAVNGAISPQKLAGQVGTALNPLAEQSGPIVQVLGSVYVVLGMGMVSVHLSLALVNLVAEWLPARSTPVVMLPRRGGRLLFRPRGRPSDGPRLGLIYLGLQQDQPRFRLDLQLDGQTRRVEQAVPGRWEAGELFDRLPALRGRGLRLGLEVLDADQDRARLRVSSSMTFTYDGDWDAVGLRVGEVLASPDPERRVLNWLTRHGDVSLAEVATGTGRDERSAAAMLSRLVDEGLVRESVGRGGSRYRVQLARKRGRALPEKIWRALDETGETSADLGGGVEGRAGRWAIARRIWEAALGGRGRFFVSVSPVLLAWLLTEWMLLTGAASFAGLLSFSGLAPVTLLAGIFPVLLLRSTRSKGDVVPRIVLPLLGHPLVVGGIYLLFLANLFLHGLIIWQSAVERASALLAGVLVLGATVAMVRRGAFAPRTVVELRAEAGPAERAVFAITSAGRPAPARVRLSYSEGEQDLQGAAGEVPRLSALRSATFSLAAVRARELKVWVHRVTPEGESEGLPALLEVHDGDDIRRFDLALFGGQIVLPLRGDDCRLTIRFPEPTTADRPRARAGGERIDA